MDIKQRRHLLCQRWDGVARRKELKNPWMDFKKPESLEEWDKWEAYTRDWLKQMYEYCARQIFHTDGYEAFLRECEHWCIEYYKHKFFPCESRSESQCCFYCPIFEDCAIRRCEE